MKETESISARKEEEKRREMIEESSKPAETERWGRISEMMENWSLTGSSLSLPFPQSCLLSS